jgi:hypothetical protein
VDAEADHVLARGLHLEPNLSLVGEFDGISAEVEQDLDQAPRIADNSLRQALVDGAS